MTELYDDTDLRSAFRELVAIANPYVRPPGADLARNDARSRTRTRRLVVSAAAALAIFVPVGIIALFQINGSSTLPQPPATDPAVTSPPPTGSPSPTEAPVGRRIGGPGELLGSMLTLSWPDGSVNETCGGAFTVVDGFATVMGQSTMSLDVDGDGSREIVAEIFCPMEQAGPTLLVALRPHPDTPTILGTVLATAWDGSPVDPEGRGPATIRDYVGLDDGTIQVDVSDKFTCCGASRQSAVVQQRTYGWTGSSFAQVAGPTTFVADSTVADIEVTVPTLAFSAPAGGYRTGTLSVTIHNNGPQTAAAVSVYIEHQFGIETPWGGDWFRCLWEGQISAVCELGDVAPGQTVTLTLPVRRSSEYEAEESPHFSAFTGHVEARTGVFYYPSVTFGLTAA